MIPFSRPSVGKEELKAVAAVLRSGWLTHGPANEELERSFADYVGVKHAVTFNSCASALFVAVKSLGITGEVILPSFTFAASANAVETAGATPVFADIDPRTMCIDPTSLEERITRRTEAIMAVHVAGLPCDMGAIGRIAARHGLAVIEDSAEAIGAEHEGRRTGSFGVGCFSFFPTKNMTTGEGGMITTNDPRIAACARTLGAHGIPRSEQHRLKSARPWRRAATMAGFNLRMSNLLAAIGVAQLKKLSGMNGRRIAHADYLNDRLGALGIEVPRASRGSRHVYQMYIVRVDPRLRGRLFAHLVARGVAATVFSDPPVHLHPYYRRKYRGTRSDLPSTDLASRSNIALPMFPQLSRKALDAMIAAIKDFTCHGEAD